MRRPPSARELERVARGAAGAARSGTARRPGRRPAGTRGLAPPGPPPDTACGRRHEDVDRLDLDLGLRRSERANAGRRGPADRLRPAGAVRVHTDVHGARTGAAVGIRRGGWPALHREGVLESLAKDAGLVPREAGYLEVVGEYPDPEPCFAAISLTARGWGRCGARTSRGSATGRQAPVVVARRRIAMAASAISSRCAVAAHVGGRLSSDPAMTADALTVACYGRLRVDERCGPAPGRWPPRRTPAPCGCGRLGPARRKRVSVAG
jgi:hypothetical protein